MGFAHFGALEIVAQFHDDSIAGEKPHIMASTSIVIWGTVGYFTAHDEVCAFTSFLLIINEPKLDFGPWHLYALLAGAPVVILQV